MQQVFSKILFRPHLKLVLCMESLCLIENLGSLNSKTRQELAHWLSQYDRTSQPTKISCFSNRAQPDLAFSI
jgi:hypothetical protein